MLDNKAIYGARFLKGTDGAMMFMPPEKSAAAPRPARARPTISMVDETATAQSREPSLKTRIPQRKVYLVSK